MSFLPVFLALSPAMASPSYPSAASSELGMECIPSCLLCHSTAAGGSGTATQPFGVALQEQGLGGGGDDVGLAVALGALAEAGTDSDGDGRPDVEELTAGGNPNPDGVDFCSVPQLERGCFPESAGWILGPGVVLAAFRLFRVRARQGCADRRPG
jgi:hypothetical protein